MRILKAKQVAEKTSISIPHIRRMAREGRFPFPVKLSEHRSGWLEADVDEWIGECVRKHRPK
jgi:prophage regulatory protein